MLIIFLGLGSHLPMWDSCWVNINMFLIFSVMLVCHPKNLLIHQPLFPSLICHLLCYSQIPLAFDKFLVLFRISHLLDWKSVMLSTRSVSLCMLLLRVNGLLLNVSCVTWKVRHLMTPTLLMAHLYPFMGSLTPIGRGVLMIENLLVDILFLSVPPLFHGNLGSNALLLAPSLK